MAVYKVSVVPPLFRIEENNLKCNRTCVKRQTEGSIWISSWSPAAPSYLHYKRDPHQNNNILSQHDRTSKLFLLILCVLDRASSWYLNKGWPTRWHLLYYILLNMFQTLIRPSSGASEYLLCCVGWLEACWCYVAGLSVGDVVSESAYTQIPHHQQTIPLHNTSTPQVSLHNITSNR